MGIMSSLMRYVWASHIAKVRLFVQDLFSDGFDIAAVIAWAFLITSLNFKKENYENKHSPFRTKP